MLSSPDSLAPVAVVLGGNLTKKGTPSQATMLRALRAVELAKANPDLIVILSGDGRTSARSKQTEAELMARILESNGISRSRLLIEDEARDTVGNAVLVATRYLKNMTPRQLFIITSPFHAERALLQFSGVLDPAWQIEVVVSKVARLDRKRGANESGGIEWTRNFLAGIQPGDLTALTARLLEQRPFYAFSAWLTN
jgi:uncharacterized SAM-binding protein YcdF (DUF218 family)